MNAQNANSKEANESHGRRQKKTTNKMRSARFWGINLVLSADLISITAEA
jgi:hypothetical protein